MSLHAHALYLFLFCAFLVCFHHSASAQWPSPSQPPYPSFKPTSPKEPLVNYFGSTDAPFWHVLLKPPHNLSESYNKLLSFIKHVDLAVRYATTPDDDNNQTLLTTCNHRDDGWRSAVGTYFVVRGLAISNTDCVSDVYGATRADGLKYPLSWTNSDSIPQFTDRSVYNAVVNHSKHVAGAASYISFPGWLNNSNNDNNNNNNASEPTRARQFRHDVRTQQCLYDYAGFVFVQNAWFVVERITNDLQTVVRGEGQRRFAYEFIRPETPATAMRFRNANNNDNGTEITGVTTSLANYTGAVTGSAFKSAFAADNLAVLRALQRGEHQTQQARDATTVSNIAILVFPLVMNLVPVALIADVNTIGMLLYTLLTDVLTAVPLAIKGVEVLAIGKRVNYAVVTRISGANQKSENVHKVAEVWVAKCGAKGSFTATGVTLLTIALLFMVGGIGAEFWAKYYVRRKKRRKNKYGYINNNNSSSLGSGDVVNEDDEDSTDLLFNGVETGNGSTQSPTIPPTTASASATAAVLTTIGRTMEDGQYGEDGGGTIPTTSPSTAKSGNGATEMVARDTEGVGMGVGVTKRGYLRPQQQQQQQQQHYGSMRGRDEILPADVGIGARGTPPDVVVRGRHGELRKRA